jgi:hypothetical protein
MQLHAARAVLKDLMAVRAPIAIEERIVSVEIGKLLPARP